MKKIIALVLAMIMLMSVFAGCGKSSAPDKETTAGDSTELPDNLNETGWPIVNEKITLTLCGMTPPTLISDWNESLFFKRMEENTNIAFDCNAIPNASWKEKFNLMFAGEDLPDVFFKANMSQQDIQAYCDQGYLIDLAPMIPKYAPNIAKLLAEDPQFKAAITLPDGRIPTLPQVGQPIPLEPLWLNQDWLEKLKLDMPTNADELYEVLKAFKEKDPNGNGKADEIPLILFGDDGCVSQIRVLLAYFGILFCRGEASDMYVDPFTNELVYGPESDAFKEALQFMKKLYDEGLMDYESFTQTQAQAKAKGMEADPRLGGFLTSSPLLVVGLERHYDYGIVPAPEYNGHKGWPLVRYITPGKFAITNTCEAPEAVLRWVDYFYSQEGGEFLWMGMKDSEYKINEDGSWDWIIPEGEDEKSLRAKISMQPGGNFPGIVPELWNKTKNPVESHLIKWRGTVRDDCYLTMPVIYYDRTDAKQLSSLTTDLGTYIDQAIAQFITGELDLEKDWDTYLNTLKQMGSEDVKNIVTANYEKIQ